MAGRGCLAAPDFAPPVAVNRRWVSDLTEIPTDEGVLYLASVLDLHSRRCPGYAMGVHHDADLAGAAVQMAITVRRSQGQDVAGVVFRTDQGGEFSGGELVRVCAAAGIVQSMGRTGSAPDNAVAESFHSTIEFEVLSRARFATREQARRAMAAWLGEYDTVRLHSTNGMLGPVDYEHGRRRPGAKTYDQLRRRRRRRGPDAGPGPAARPENLAEAATPPGTSDGPLRDGRRRRAAYGPVPPASRTEAADAAPLRGVLDPGASTGPAGETVGRPGACRRAHAAQPEQDP